MAEIDSYGVFTLSLPETGDLIIPIILTILRTIIFICVRDPFPPDRESSEFLDRNPQAEVAPLVPPELARRECPPPLGPPAQTFVQLVVLVEFVQACVCLNWLSRALIGVGSSDLMGNTNETPCPPPLVKIHQRGVQ